MVVGIDDYPGDRYDLRAARNDGVVLVEGLRRSGVPDHQIRTVWDQEATVGGVLDAVDWVVANADAQDTVVFLYAGHVRDLGGGTEVLVTAERGYIADWYLADRFARLDVRDAWFVIAGCYGGGFDELLAPGRVLTAAAPAGQLAFEDDYYGLSFLGEYLLRRAFANGEAGAPTVQAVTAWAMANLAVDHPDRQLWHVDIAGHTIALDGTGRDEPAPEVPGPAAPAANCVLGILCSTRD
ncbi:MAG: caspase family protein [Acidimicrobiia bacterium]|nr:caspase family protein [Acidimicrobiia bacterium]